MVRGILYLIMTKECHTDIAIVTIFIVIVTIFWPPYWPPYCHLWSPQGHLHLRVRDLLEAFQAKPLPYSKPTEDFLIHLE